MTRFPVMLAVVAAGAAVCYRLASPATPLAYPNTVHPWHDPNLPFIDKVLNAMMPFLLPLTAMSTMDAEGIASVRAKFEGMEKQGYAPAEPYVVGAEKLRVKDQSGERDLEIVLHRLRPGKTADDTSPPCKAKLVVWLHGGGMVLGVPRDGYGAGAMALLDKELAKRDQEVGACDHVATEISVTLTCAAPVCPQVEVVWASVAYSRSPEFKWPAAPADVVKALTFLLKSPVMSKQYFFDPQDVHLAGVSAGGMLAIVSALRFLQTKAGNSLQSIFVDEPMLLPSLNKMDKVLSQPDPAGSVPQPFQWAPSFTRNAATGIDPSSWLRWCWAQYSPGGSVDVLEGAMKPGTWAAAGKGRPAGLPPAVLLTAQGDPLHDGGASWAEIYRAAFGEVTHVEANSSHCLGVLTDSHARDALFEAWADVLLR